MPAATLALHPETPGNAVRGIFARVSRERGILRVSYVVEADLELLRIPPSRPPRFADRLWQHTCCELFVARKGETRYHEFNFSPSGEWAAYAFSRYREQAAGDEPLDPQITVHRAPDNLELDAAIHCEAQGRLLLGLSAVIEDQDGTLSYWALRHPAGKPDFHHPDAFALELDEVRD